MEIEAGNRKKYVITVEGGTASIPLSNGRVALIDAADVELVKDYCWACDPAGYARRTDRRANVASKAVKLHRLILGCAAGETGDHISGDKLDNRRSNLRVVNRRQNVQNRKGHSKSELKGIGRVRDTGRWKGKICVNGKQIHLGVFESPNEAATAYDRAAIKFFGEHARLNFPTAFTPERSQI